MKTVSKLVLMASVTAILSGCGTVAPKHNGHDDGHSGHDMSTMKKSDDHSGHSMGKMEGHAEHGGHGGDSAVGKSAKGMAATKTYQVTMLDSMEFKFSAPPALKNGDVVKFVVTNKGLIDHEFSIGNAAEQVSHAAMMKKMPGMVHEDGNTITVKPGETKELLWQFTGNDEVVFACNVPGHFEAGMMHKTRIQ